MWRRSIYPTWGKIVGGRGVTVSFSYMYIMGARYDSGVLAVRNFPFFVYLIKKTPLASTQIRKKVESRVCIWQAFTFYQAWAFGNTCTSTLKCHSALNLGSLMWS